MKKERLKNATVKTYAITALFILIWNVLFSFTPLLLVSPTAQPERLPLPMLQWLVKDTTISCVQERPAKRVKITIGHNVWHDGWLYIRVWMISVGEYTMSNMWRANGAFDIER